MRDEPTAPAPPEAEPGYLGAGEPASEEDPRLKPDDVDNE
jgi:hypothetical protein